jgi:hypothetical protein
MADHPLFGRADDSFADDQTAQLLEGQLHCLCDTIQNEIDRLDAFVPSRLHTDDQVVSDWESDVRDAVGLIYTAKHKLLITLGDCKRRREKSHTVPLRNTVERA